jgi:hypothetical protein
MILHITSPYGCVFDLHRITMTVELIDDFFAEHPATADPDKVDTSEADEVIDAIAETVAELTSQQDGLIRQQLMRENYDVRREDAAGVIGSYARH